LLRLAGLSWAAGLGWPVHAVAGEEALAAPAVDPRASLASGGPHRAGWPPTIADDSARLFGSFTQRVLRPPDTGRGESVGATASVAAAHADVHQLWRQLDRDWNAWKGGELGRLNRWLASASAAGSAGRPGQGGDSSRQVSPALHAVLLRAAELEQVSGGLFNPALGGVVAAWGFHADRLPGDLLPPPDAQALQRWRAGAAAGLQRALVWQGGRRLLAPVHPLNIDLGGLGKGAAADLALELLAHRHGVNDALVNLGGHVACRGLGPSGAWQIGLRDPWVAAAENGAPALAAGLASPAPPAAGAPAALMARLAAGPRESVVTSGQYERWRRLRGGRRAGHILDPSTLAPAAGLLSVTVVHADGVLADAAATALLVAGPQRWPELAQRMGVDQVLVVDEAGQASLSAALAPRLQFGPAWPAARRRVV
jgi:thiamine biosynthesis lipoprotein